MKTALNTAAAPAAIGPYSQGIAAQGKMIFLSGQLPIDPATGAFPEGGIKEQTRNDCRRVIDNIKMPSKGYHTRLRTN